MGEYVLRISCAVSYSQPRSAIASNFCGCFLHKQVDGFTVILKQLRARCSASNFSLGNTPGGEQETLK